MKKIIFLLLLLLVFKTASAQEDMLLFYENSTGFNERYSLTNEGKLKKGYRGKHKWQNRWDNVVAYTVKNKRFLLVYDKQTGYYKTFNLLDNGELGQLVKDGNDWRKSWTQILPFYYKGKTFMMFYEKTTGYHERYLMKSDGSLGPLHKSNYSWGKSWDQILCYQVKGQNYLLFYSKARGYFESYKFLSLGILDKSSINSGSGWRKTWNQIIPYEVNGKTFMYFYEKASGYNEHYAINTKGLLGKKYKGNNSWRKTWADITYIPGLQTTGSNIPSSNYTSSAKIEFTQELIRLKPITNLCPSTLVGGDLEFGGNGPKVFGSVSLSRSEDSKSLIAEIRFNARETKKDFLTGRSEVKGFWKIPVYTAPEGKFINGIVDKPFSQTNFEKVLKGGGQNEIFGGGDGSPHNLTVSNGLDDKGHVALLRVVGDTGGWDISTDNNCKNDTRILKIVFDDILLEFTNKE